MTLKEIIEACSRLSIFDKRIISDQYHELVFYNKEIDEWNKIFTVIFGPALKPAGAKPTRDDSRLTKDYGGIFANQTLFKKKFDDITVIAMFWPWQDNIHITLKMVVLEK